MRKEFNDNQEIPMDLIDSLMKHLHSVRMDRETGLTSKTIRNRAFDFREENGKLYFDMERHRGAFGSMSKPGAPLAACAARMETYRFDPDTNVIEVVFRSSESLDIDDIDYGQLVEDHFFNLSFEVEQNPGNSYTVTETCSNVAWQVSSFEEAVQYLRTDIAESAAEIFTPEPNLEIDEADIEEVRSLFRETAEEHLLELLELAWKEAD